MIPRSSFRSDPRIFFLLVFLTLLFPVSARAETLPVALPPLGVLVPQVEVRILAAEEKILEGIQSVELLLKSAKTDRSEMTGAFAALVENCFDSPAVRELSVMRTLLKVRLDQDQAPGSLPPGLRDLEREAAELIQFAEELAGVQEAVAWTERTNHQIGLLRFDVTHAPLRLGAFVKELQTIAASLVQIRSRLEGLPEKGLSPQQIQSLKRQVENDLKLTAVLKYRTQSAAFSLIKTAQAVGEGKAYVPDREGFKRMDVLAEFWREVPALYPLISRELVTAVGRWAPLPKSRWEALLAERETFDKIYGPLLSGEMLRGMPLFEGMGYPALPQVVAELERTARVGLARLEGLERDLEKYREALAQDGQLTARERQELLLLEARFGPQAARVQRIALATAGGGSRAISELERRIEGLPAGSEERRRHEEDLGLLRRKQHPDQIAADRQWREFLRLSSEAQRRADEIVEGHIRRRQSLSLPPVLKRLSLEPRE